MLPPCLAVIVGDRFPRHRRRERHGEEIENLRLGFAENDLELTLAADDDAGDTAGALVLLMRWQGDEGRIGLTQGKQPLGEWGKALHLSEAAGQGTVDGRVGQARQFEGKIGSRDLAAAAVPLAQLETRIAVKQDAVANFEQV